MKCNPCNNVCLTCSLIATNCTTCNSTSGFPYLNKTTSSSTCLAQCPSGMYPDSNQSPTLCVSCVGPCVTCTTSTACLSCITGKFLYLTSCLSGCPADYSVESILTNTCETCNAVCDKCKGTTTNCTSCA